VAKRLQLRSDTASMAIMKLYDLRQRLTEGRRLLAPDRRLRACPVGLARSLVKVQGSRFCAGGRGAMVPWLAVASREDLRVLRRCGSVCRGAVRAPGAGCRAASWRAVRAAPTLRAGPVAAQYGLAWPCTRTTTVHGLGQHGRSGGSLPAKKRAAPGGMFRTQLPGARDRCAVPAAPITSLIAVL
jgi:hypothetical protein